ncbi:MAG: haloacid dehalogenase-like hydrolase [Eubacterium sp.]
MKKTGEFCRAMNVYDFDNTIYDGETLVDFILYYVRTDPRIWKYVPKLLVICFKDAFHLFTVEDAVDAYAGFLEGYYTKIDTIEADVKKFWDKNEYKIKPWYEMVRKPDDIIVSGSTDFLLDEIMKRMGIKNYIGSSIDKKTGKFKRLCFLENKVKFFKESFPNAHIDNFYTDSMNDKAMMDIADHVYFVKGDKIEQIK